MNATQVAVLVAAVLAYLSVVVGVWFVFSTPAGTPRELHLVRAVVVVGDIAEVAVIALSGPVPAARGIPAIVLFAVSLALFAWCAAVTRRNRLSIAFSPDTPRHVLRSGPFQWVRHPFYSGYIVSYVAGVVATANPWLLTVVAAVTAVFAWAAVVEESKFSNSSLAAEYAGYARVTGMFLPRWR